MLSLGIGKREEEEEAEPELDENGEPIVVKEPLYFKETDFHLRVPHADFNDLKPYLEPSFKAKDKPLRVIVPGCGNSDLSQKLVEKMGLTLDQILVESFDYEE